MEDERKTKKQLISEVVELRQWVAALNATETERRQAGAVLRESGARFRNLLDYIPGVSIQGYTADGIVRYWNKASEEVYGYTAEEAIGRNLGDLIIPPEVKPQFKQALELGAKCTKSGEFMPPGELMLLHKNGSLVPVYSIHTVVCLSGGPPLMFCIDVDLSERKRTEEALRKAHNELERRVEERTAELAKAVASLRKEIEERKRVEEALRESERRYFLATSAGRVGVWDWNLDTNEIYLDPMVKAFLGYEDHEIRNHIDDWGERVHPADRERVMAEATKHLEGASLHYEIEHRMLHKDGSIRWFLARGTAMRDRSGKPYRMLGTDTDITERKQADEALKRSEARLAEAQYTAHLGGWEWDIVKHEVHWSTELYRIFDVDPDEFKPSKAAFLECVHPDDRPYLEDCIAAILSNKEPFSVDHRITLPSGTIRFLHSEARLECDAANKPVRLVGIAQDITERKQAEEDARRHREELSHVTRVATMGELAASLAHEINQPLTAIMSNAQAAQRFLDGDEPDLEEVGEILLDIAKDGGRASGVIQRLREMIKKGDLERSPLDINNVIHQVIMFIHGEAEEKRVSITFDLATGLPPVLGDSVQLQQVVLNLVLNGLEAISQVEQGSRELVVRTSKDKSDTISVAVCDTGIGLHDDVMERIFDPFFTTKPQGMGMGLSICRSIVEAHGGFLWAENNPDGGATFWFTLPISSQMK